MPGFETRIGRVELLPTLTFPKCASVGFNDSWAVEAVTPVPERPTIVCVAETLVVIAIYPETVPAVVGVNCTLKVVEPPALTFVGKVSPLIV